MQIIDNRINLDIDVNAVPTCKVKYVNYIQEFDELMTCVKLSELCNIICFAFFFGLFTKCILNHIYFQQI